MENRLQEQINKYWSGLTRKSRTQAPQRSRWWQSPRIIRHINRLVCGDAVPGFSQGLIELLRERLGGSIPFGKGVSVGCGSGQKEMALLRQGLVEHFDLYEFSTERIRIGEQLCQQAKLEGRLRFINGDALQLVTSSEAYDLVHWNNSLHHMMDVDRAVAWSKKVLRPGGVFYMDDFVGADRFQWPDRELEIASRVREIFAGSSYLRNPSGNTEFLPTLIRRPDPNKLIKQDPSEAADSAQIRDAIFRHFPDADFKYTGGVVYHLALNDMLHNFDETDDQLLLELMMLIDELCAELGHSHYAVALATKS